MDATEYVSFRYDTAEVENGQAMCACICMALVLMAQWTDCIVDKILKKVEIGKFITTALKSILKLVKLQSFVAKRCKMWKM